MEASGERRVRFQARVGRVSKRRERGRGEIPCINPAPFVSDPARVQKRSVLTRPMPRAERVASPAQRRLSRDRVLGAAAARRGSRSIALPAWRRPDGSDPCLPDWMRAALIEWTVFARRFSVSLRCWRDCQCPHQEKRSQRTARPGVRRKILGFRWKGFTARRMSPQALPAVLGTRAPQADCRAWCGSRSARGNTLSVGLDTPRANREPRSGAAPPLPADPERSGLAPETACV